MSTTNLKNITIKKLEDKNFKPYYLIVNNDNLDEVYFCFERAVKEGWNELVKLGADKRSRDRVWGEREWF